jgi:hypothetical protein
LSSIDDHVLDVTIFDDRACDELREERDIEQHVEEIPLDFYHTAVHIDDIRKRLECEERNTDGKRDLRCGQRRAEERIHCLDKHARILEDDQQAQVGNDGDDHRKPVLALRRSGDPKRVEVVHHRTQEHEEHIHRFPIGVEAEACDDEQRVLHLQRRHDGIEQEHSYQKNAQEY